MDAVISFALRQRVLVLVAFVTMLAAGTLAFMRLNIEAYPDPVPPLVDIITQNPGQSAEEIERYITIPLEVQLAGIPYLTSMRTISLFGLSDVKLQFTYDYTYEEAEQKVLNRLAQLPQLPNNAQPQISPWSPIGDIMRYKLVGPPGYSPMDLKTLQDWVLQRRLKAVPGVIDVTGFGGKTKAYEISVDLLKLQSYGLTLAQVVQTLNNSNINVGGQTLNISEQAAVVRGVGLIRSIDDIRQTMLTQQGGLPVLMSDVAVVTVGYQPRLGVVGQDGDDDIVQGIVLMRRDSANLLSVGAIDFGLIVDATVIMVENIFRHLAERPADLHRRHDRRWRLSGSLATIFDAGREVSRAIFFAAAIIIAGFVPLFTLSGVEGHIFGPISTP